jgi:hypothetical protein
MKIISAVFFCLNFELITVIVIVTPIKSMSNIIELVKNSAETRY